MLCPATLQGGLWSSVSSSKTCREHKGFPNGRRSRVDPIQSKQKSPLPYMLVQGYVEIMLASFILMQELWAPRLACSSCGLFQDNSLGPLLRATWKHPEHWQSHIGVSSLPTDTFAPALPYSAYTVLPPILIQRLEKPSAPYMYRTTVVLICSKTDASRSINKPTWW